MVRRLGNLRVPLVPWENGQPPWLRQLAPPARAERPPSRVNRAFRARLVVIREL